MSDLQAQIQGVEREIADAKLKIKRLHALQRLEQNPDFQELITEGFLEEHAVRQVLLRANPSIRSSEQALDSVDLQIAAVGGLKQFFVGIYAMGLEAENGLQADEETLEELNAEALQSEGS